jgi:acyl-CoA-dependent ceramide synthase
MFFIISLHALSPQSRIHTGKFLHLSYPAEAAHTYTQGLDDMYFVFAWVVNFTALRAISIEHILRPLAGPLGVAPKNHLRFAEQGWLVLYYGYFWTLGMVCFLIHLELPAQSLKQNGS